MWLSPRQNVCALYSPVSEFLPGKWNTREKISGWFGNKVSGSRIKQRGGVYHPVSMVQKSTLGASSLNQDPGSSLHFSSSSTARGIILPVDLHRSRLFTGSRCTKSWHSFGVTLWEPMHWFLVMLSLDLCSLVQTGTDCLLTAAPYLTFIVARFIC